MIRAFFITTIIVVITVMTCAINPKLHKSITISFTDFKFTNQEIETNVKTTQINQIDNTKNVSTTNVNLVENSLNNQTVNVNNFDSSDYMNNIKMRYQQDQAKKLANQKAKSQQQKTQQIIKQPKDSISKSTKNVVQQNVQKTVKSKKNDMQKVSASNKPQEIPAQINQESIIQQKKLVTQQETIAWNKWRADIANAVGDYTTANLAEKVTVGTVIKYSFIVDKNEQISNIIVTIIKGETSPSAQSAKSTVYKAIRNINGKSILTFPNGSNRNKTTVEGLLELSKQAAKIDKGMYNDYETVTKQYYK